jgi:ABC-2 type transport system permease protein
MTQPSKPYNQFTAMFAVARASFRSITRSPSAVVFTLLFPVIFILVFGFIGNSSIKIKISATADSDLTNPVYTSLKETPGIKVVQDLNEDEMQNLLKKGKLDAIFEFKPVNDAIDSRTEVHMFTSSASASKAAMLKLIVENIVNNLNISINDINNNKVIYTQSEIKSRKYTMIDFILPGQIGFSILSVGVFGTSFAFFNLRQTLVIKRFFATPIKKPFIILGEALSKLIFALLGSLFIIVIGYYAFGFTLIHGVATIISMLTLAAISLIVFMGFGFIISGVAKNESMIPPLANTITLPQFLLSGTFFSIDAFPEWLQPFCRILPLTHLNEALRMVAFEGASLASLWLQIGVILLWGIGVYALAVRFFRWE